jgi:YbbR domain-containing protein
MKFLRSVVKFLPTLFSALVLAIVVWVSAVTDSDPNEETAYPEPIPISIVGLDPNLIAVSDIPEHLNLTILAPKSIHTRLVNEPNLIKVTLNLSGLGAGVFSVVPQVDLAVRPAEVTLVSPESITVELESLISKELPVTFNQIGSLPISYEAAEPDLSIDLVTITGAKSKVDSVSQVMAEVDLANVTTDINKQVELKALNTSGSIVKDVTLNPGSLQVIIPIKQLGGYRNVFVKIITSGQIASGFYLTNLYAYPPNVTIYTADSEIAKNMPAFVETNPINLNGADEDFEINIPLNLPDGISIIGEPTIQVQVGIAAIESSKNFLDVEIQVINLAPKLTAALSAETVDIYLSGPLYLLDELNLIDITVTLDLADHGVGTYQLVPQLTLMNEKIKVDAILPGTIEVTISQ